MSRRHFDTFLPPPQRKLQPINQFSQPQPEQYHALPAQTHAVTQETEAPPKTEVLKPDPPPAIPRPLTDAQALAIYNSAKGSCPLCKIRIGKGITGHLSKCLRIWNSSSESPTTT